MAGARPGVVLAPAEATAGAETKKAIRGSHVIALNGSNAVIAITSISIYEVSPTCLNRGTQWSGALGL